MDAFPHISAFFRALPDYTSWMEGCLDRGLRVYRGPDCPETFVAAVTDTGTVVYEAMCYPSGGATLEDTDDAFHMALLLMCIRMIQRDIDAEMESSREAFDSALDITVAAVLVVNPDITVAAVLVVNPDRTVTAAVRELVER